MLVLNSFFFLPSGAGYARLSEDPGDRGRDLELRFSAFFQCDNKACNETASVAGVGQEKEEEDPGSLPRYYEVFFPRFVSPSPHLFAIPAVTPAAITSLIESAFVLSWGDYEACLNRVRMCLESILDEQRVNRFAIRKGERKPIILHERIGLANIKLPATKPYLMAVKHLGNAGSHRGGLVREDVFDALDLLEAIVTTLYGQQKKINQLAQKIEKNKGPLKRIAK